MRRNSDQRKNILAKDADVDAIRLKMGMVYQQFNLFSHLNVLENIILAPMKVLKTPKETAIKEAEALLDRVGMLRYQYLNRSNAMLCLQGA